VESSRLHSVVESTQYHPHVRYVGEDNFSGTMLLEYAPTLRTIFVDYMPIRLYFPYTYFAISYWRFPVLFGWLGTIYRFRELYIGISSERNDNLNGSVARVPLGNILNQFRVCLGDGVPVAPFLSASGLVNAVIRNFWASSFERTCDLVPWHTATKQGAGIEFFENCYFDLGRSQIPLHQPFFHNNPQPIVARTVGFREDHTILCRT
jgi:hypothetical protein